MWIITGCDKNLRLVALRKVLAELIIDNVVLNLTKHIFLNAKYMDLDILLF